MNNLDLIHERQCASIYRAFETHNLPRAVIEADKLLKKQPTLHLATALKALALAESHRRKDANAACDQLVALKQALSPAVVLPLSHALSALNRDAELVDVLEASSKAHPEAEDVSEQCFGALIKARSFQKAQQTAQRMHKAFKKDLYFWWSIQAYELLASRQPRAQGAALALPLCERMIQQQLKSKPLTATSDEIAHLYVTILHKLGKDKEALDLLAPTNELGAQLCKRSLALELMRRELWCSTGAWTEVRAEAVARLRSGEQDWAYVYALCQSSAKLDAASAKGGTSSLKEARALLQERLHSDRFTRVGSLGQLETFAQQSLISPTGTLPPETQELVRAAIEAHIEVFGSKACGAGDVMPYLLGLLSVEHQEAIKTLLLESFNNFGGTYTSEDDLARHITSARLIQAIEAKHKAKSSLTAATLAQRYLAGLAVGASLPDTEGQPTDELGMLTAQAILNEHAPEDPDAVIEATAFLLYACRRSQKGYRLRVFLVKLLLQLGLFTKATHHWTLLKTAFIQHDTLGHLLLDRASLFAQGGKVDEAEVAEGLRQAASIYIANNKDTNEMIRVAFDNGTFSKVEEVVDFGEQVDRSFSRQLYRLEQAKIALTGLDSSVRLDEAASLEKVKTNAEVVLSTLREGPLCDHRDFTVLPAAPSGQPHFKPEPAALLGSIPAESDVLADAAVAAIASGVSPNESEVLALEDYAGESAMVLRIARGTLGLETGKSGAEALSEDFRGLLQETLAVLQKPTLPWRLLQHIGFLLQSISLVRMAIFRNNRDKAVDVAGHLRTVLKQTSHELQRAVDELNASINRVAGKASNTQGTVLSVLLDTVSDQESHFIQAFLDDLNDKIAETLSNAVQGLATRLRAT